MDKPENFLETTLLNIRAERLAGELIRFLEGRIESGTYHEGEGPYDDPYVIMTAIEGVLCHLMQRFDEEEHFPILSIFVQEQLHPYHHLHFQSNRLRLLLPLLH